MECQTLTQEMFSRLPVFVRQYLEELIKDDCPFEEGEEERVRREMHLLAATTFASVTGTINHPYNNVNKPVYFWIGSHDRTLIHLYVGGCGCWMLPNNHFISFSPIPIALLSPEPYRQTWWAIVYDERAHRYCVYQIPMRPEGEVAGTFPDRG